MWCTGCPTIVDWQHLIQVSLQGVPCPPAFWGCKHRWGLNPRPRSFDATTQPTELSVSKIFVRCAGWIGHFDSCFPLGGFIYSFEAHPVRGSSRHICTHAVVWRLTLTGSPCIRQIFLGGFIYSFEARPVHGWCTDCPTILDWQHLI